MGANCRCDQDRRFATANLRARSSRTATPEHEIGDGGPVAELLAAESLEVGRLDRRSSALADVRDQRVRLMDREVDRSRGEYQLVLAERTGSDEAGFVERERGMSDMAARRS